MAAEPARELAVYRTDAPRAFRLAGSLSCETADVLVEALGVQGEAVGDIVFDLADLTFVDSIGLHVIAHVAAQLGSRGQVTIERADPWLRKVLAISGIEALVNVEVTERSR